MRAVVLSFGLQSPVGEVVSPLIEEETDVPRSNQPPTNYLGVVLIYLAAAALVRPRPHSSPTTFNASARVRTQRGFVGLTARIF